MRFPALTAAPGIAIAAALIWALLPQASAGAFELERGLNNAGIIKYPTALKQPVEHTIHGTVELTDIGEPELNLYNLRYGLQLGAFQIITDLNYNLSPVHEFDYGEVKGKLQLLNLDEFRLTLALGLLGRFVQHSEERMARIDDKTASLFGIVSVELFPFRQWGGILFNFYLENRSFVLGLKGQIYQSIQLVAEGEALHSTESPEDRFYRAGVAFEGEENLYVQLLYANEGEHYLLQIGTGF